MMVPQAAAAAGTNMRPGDWSCSKCGNHNYASRAECNRCGSAKVAPAMSSMPGPGMYSATSKGGLPGRYNPYPAAPALPFSAMPGKMRQGDWICQGCGNHNYASREMCNKCNRPKAAPPTFRDGDWMCPKCNNHNYASKMACNRCQEPRPA
mmetsp:Transcript_22965/g.46735  ORF Transcript_22965/g.46735 Transcript_22965/m.46735 type:complete len:151 (+) Transcript_22965:2-454(+)